MDKFDPTPDLRHGAAERLRFIDSRLFWEARINRADLIEAFAISPAQAALDFREYLKLCSGAVAYDTRLKAYIAGPGFTPVFAPPDATSTLKSLGEADDRWIYRLPELERPLDPEVAARLRRAARDGERLLVDYQSFTRPQSTRRWIAPARLISDGYRWHARAWSYERQEWRDFVLARVTLIHAGEPAGELPDDTEWNESIELVLRPARRLSPGQRASVAREFAMIDGRLSVRVPRALRIYAIRRWGLDRPESRLELAE
jgi:hypothetical protein